MDQLRQKAMSASALVCLIATVSLAAASAKADDIKLGFMGPMTGQLASEGQDLENGVKLAVAKINAKGGIHGDKIIVITADDACDPQQAVAAASKLVSSGVNAVVGGYCSGAVLPTLKIYGDAGVPFVSIGANSTKLVTANPGNAFLINSTGDAQAETAMALFKKMGFKKLALVDEGDAYSSDLAKLVAAEFTKSGGSVIAETVSSGEQDFSSVIAKIRAARPDAVLWTAYHGAGALLTKQLRQSGFQGAIVLGDGNNSPEYLQIAGSAAERAYLFSPPVLDFLPGAAAFKQEYQQAAKRDPGAYAALAYDSANLVGNAIDRANSKEGKAITAALKASDFTGLAGTVKFTPKNTLVGSNFTTLQAKGGKWIMAE